MPTVPNPCPTVPMDPQVRGGVPMAPRIYKRGTWARIPTVPMGAAEEGENK